MEIRRNLFYESKKKGEKGRKEKKEERRRIEMRSEARMGFSYGGIRMVEVDGILDPEREYNRGLRLWGSPCRPLKVVGPCLPP